MNQEFCFYAAPEGRRYGDSDMIRAAGHVGHIGHLGHGSFVWTAKHDGVEVGVVFQRLTDRPTACDALPPVWQGEWGGRVHTLIGDVDVLVELLVALWGDHPVTVHSIEGGKGVVAKHKEVA